MKKGGPEVPKTEEGSDLFPALGEVRIPVKATGLNFADIMILHGCNRSIDYRNQNRKDELMK
ncbi:hypothetical protein LPTSP3_g24590 [Leptospira kobayashii]|uniref:Uncharacterized protein n=1 Tax=Leptospira kobayashii TaxID=1917830 RepID=A0ABM7US36_9LEPT|nr:hypothetical protein LPTSP3_g24590 [Leptospira kobayashii]